MTKDVTHLFMRLKLQSTTNGKPYLCPAKSMKYDFADSQCVFSVVTVKNSPNPLFTNKILGDKPSLWASIFFSVKWRRARPFSLHIVLSVDSTWRMHVALYTADYRGPCIPCAYNWPYMEGLKTWAKHISSIGTKVKCWPSIK